MSTKLIGVEAHMQNFIICIPTCKRMKKKLKEYICSNIREEVGPAFGPLILKMKYIKKNLKFSIKRTEPSSVRKMNK